MSTWGPLYDTTGTYGGRSHATTTALISSDAAQQVEIKKLQLNVAEVDRVTRSGLAALDRPVTLVAAADSTATVNLSLENGTEGQLKTISLVNPLIQCAVNTRRGTVLMNNDKQTVRLLFAGGRWTVLPDIVGMYMHPEGLGTHQPKVPAAARLGDKILGASTSYNGNRIVIWGDQSVNGTSLTLGVCDWSEKKGMFEEVRADTYERAFPVPVSGSSVIGLVVSADGNSAAVCVGMTEEQYSQYMFPQGQSLLSDGQNFPLLVAWVAVDLSKKSVVAPFSKWSPDGPSSPSQQTQTNPLCLNRFLAGGQPAVVELAAPQNLAYVAARLEPLGQNSTAKAHYTAFWVLQVDGSYQFASLSSLDPVIYDTVKREVKLDFRSFSFSADGTRLAVGGSVTLTAQNKVDSVALFSVSVKENNTKMELQYKGTIAFPTAAEDYYVPFLESFATIVRLSPSGNTLGVVSNGFSDADKKKFFTGAYIYSDMSAVFQNSKQNPNPSAYIQANGVETAPLLNLHLDDMFAIMVCNNSNDSLTSGTANAYGFQYSKASAGFAAAWTPVIAYSLPVQATSSSSASTPPTKISLPGLQYTSMSIDHSTFVVAGANRSQFYVFS